MDAGAAGEGERPYCVSAGEYKGVEIVFVDVWKTNVYEEFARIRSIMADFPYVAMVTLTRRRRRRCRCFAPVLPPARFAPVLPRHDARFCT